MGFVSSALTLVTLFLSSVAEIEEFHSFSKIPQRCAHLPLLDVLPGRGWDGLRDQDMGQVISVSYSDCHTTKDGRYVIPNNMEAIPIKSSNIELSTELIEHWTNYTSLTSRKMNSKTELNLESVEIPVQIKPFFSPGYEETKRQMVEQRAILVRASLRYVLYSVRALPNSPLDPLLEKAIRDAAEALKQNDVELANCILGFIVRDYGTHFTMSVDAGALFLENNYVDESWVRAEHLSSRFLTSLVAVSFVEFFQLSMSVNTSVGRSVLQNYQRHRMKKTLQTLGGPLFDMRMTIDDWRAKVDENLVAIDRAGEFISHIANPFRFPEVDSRILNHIYHILNKIVKNYVANNNRIGCMIPGSRNFDYNANIQGPCEYEPIETTFGGVYMTCSRVNMSAIAGNPCDDMEGTNPLTGDKSCPFGYISIPLHKWLKTVSKATYDCDEICKGWWIFRRCRTECNTNFHKSLAQMESYWCAVAEKPPPQWGYLVGGLFSNNIPNPVTRDYRCPPAFITLKITPHAWICVGNNNPLNARASMEFGGFYTCSTRNPLATNGTDINHICPPHHKQFMLTIEHNCLINYCAKFRPYPQNYKNDAIIRPPFKNSTSLSKTIEDFECNF